MKKKPEILIIGQGLAGSCLALQLEMKGVNFHVLDRGTECSSSVVAPGIVNPIVFKRLTKSWMVDTLLDKLAVFYEEAGKLLNESKPFYEKQPILKLFSSQKEQNDWEIKSEDRLFRQHLGKVVLPKELPSYINTSFGGGVVVSSGRLDVPRFLLSVRNYLEKVRKLTNTLVDPFYIRPKETSVEYLGKEYDYVVFCEGAAVKDNPYFQWLPFKPAKGEIMKIRCEQVDVPYILNKNGFVLPLGEGCFKVGATYEWEDLSHKTTEKGKGELQKKLETMLSVEYEVMGYDTGIRPAVKDRRPVLGKHPVHEKIAIFNGMGTKGVMLAPYFSNIMAGYLIGGNPLPKEVDVKRFKKNFKEKNETLSL